MIVNDDFSPEWAGTSERYTLCTKSTGRRRGGVQTIPTQACRFPTRKLRARRGYDPPKRDPTCFSWHPRSVQQQKKGAQQLWTLPGQLGTWTCVSMQLSGVRTIYCGYQDKPELYLFDNATRATPAGPFATKEGSIFSHHARHSTSCSSEYRTLSTKSSTDLVLLMPASALNYRVYQVLLQFTISKRTCLLLSLRLSSFSQLLPGLLNIIGACWCWPIDKLIILWKNPVPWYTAQTSQLSPQYPPFQYIPWPAESKAALLPCHSPHYWMSSGSSWTT